MLKILWPSTQVASSSWHPLRLALGLSLLVAWSAAYGHFLLNINIRTVHVQHLGDGLRVLMRLPLPYVLTIVGAPHSAR